MKKTLSIVLFVLLVFLAVACSPEHKHDYQLVESKTVKATCESGGYDYMECSCGAIQSIPTAALGHAYVEDKEQYVAPTCVATGTKVEYCSRCEKPNTVTLPKNANNHPFFGEEDSSGEIMYEGLIKDLETATVSVWPTCASDGKATFTHCSACDKDIEFETVVPKEYFSKDNYDKAKVTAEHKKLASNASTFTSGADIDKAVLDVTADDIKEYEPGDKATAFSEGSETNICPTCGEAISDKKLASHKVPVNPDAVIGNWVYTSGDPETGKSYVRMWNEIIKKNGFYYLTSYKEKKTDGVYAETTCGLPTEMRFENLTETFETNRIDLGTENYLESYLALKNAAVAVTKNNATEGKAVILSIAEKALSGKFEKGDYVLVFLKGLDTTGTALTAVSGNGLDKTDTGYGTDGIAVVKFKSHLHSFEVINDARSISSDKHYLGCDCGLSYLKIEHGNSCETCGYNSEDWFGVSVSCGESADNYALPKGSSVYIATGKSAGTEYKNFFGKTYKYTGNAVATGASDSSSSTTFFWDGKTPGGLTLSLTEV